MINETTLGQRQLNPFASAAFTGSHHYTTHSLVDDVLAHQSEEVKQAMQQIAVLKQFNASLCNAVCATEDAARIIEQIWAEANHYMPESTFIDWIQKSLPIAQQVAWLTQIVERRRAVFTEATQSKLAQPELTQAELTHTNLPARQEPLSERELDVLKLLESDLSGPEISAQLFISINTFRTHTKNIYSKLQVNTRRAVVRRAKELSLL